MTVTTAIADIVRAVTTADLPNAGDDEAPGFLHDRSEDVVRSALDEGLSPDTIDPDSGLPLLHLAVGRNRGPIVQLLIERGVTFGPDKYGRWPSMIAGLCEVGEALGDLVVEAEAARQGV